MDSKADPSKVAPMFAMDADAKDWKLAGIMSGY
jgi:hypothetical protein